MCKIYKWFSLDIFARRTSLRFVWLIGVSFNLLIASYGICQSQDVLLFDFEDGKIGSWTVSGENPLYEMAPVSRVKTKDWSRKPEGYKGNFYLETSSDGGRHTQNPDGSLTSPEFVINRDYLNFYLGGELHPRVRVFLMVDGQVVREAFGNNFYDLILRGWDVRGLIGKKARFVIEDNSPMRSLIRLDHVFLSVQAPTDPKDWKLIPDRERSAFFVPGEFKLIFPSDRIGEDWRIVRSNFVQDDRGTWNLFFSAYQKPNQYEPSQWQSVFRASARNIETNEWEFHGEAIHSDPKLGEEFIWDPFVIFNKGEFWMYYVSGGNPWSGWYTPAAGVHKKWHLGMSGDQGPYYLSLATSKDGKEWLRSSSSIGNRKGVLFAEKPFLFAPFITKIENKWVMYYASAASESVEAKHGIGYRISTDLIHWSERKLALRDWDIQDGDKPSFPSTPASPWPEHSFFTNPAVLKHKETWYLLAGPIDNSNLSRYHTLRIFDSKDPFHWDDFDNAIHKNKRIFVDGGAIPIRGSEGQMYIATTNDMSGGIWIAPLYVNEDF